MPTYYVTIKYLKLPVAMEFPVLYHGKYVLTNVSTFKSSTVTSFSYY